MTNENLMIFPKNHRKSNIKLTSSVDEGNIKKHILPTKILIIITPKRFVENFISNQINFLTPALFYL